ncbi:MULTISPECIES: hypothetical protein [unclassified Thalassospira]|uniref:hypothetical protein n=1 Tax=unclassified Thalassospira TaxID=2648997 RepID=UPI001B2D894D|nr:hypothetical protein [Thalassospira sp.]MBO6770373.1 hypothetical protein [Thalassospira sp.]
MAQDTLYISPEFNPHSLERDWGFVMRSQYPAMYAALSKNLSALRRAMFDHVIAQATVTQNQGDQAKPPALQNDAKVTTESVSPDTQQLYREIGLDTLSLALLADVPIDRPLQISHNSLVGHWRWLRQVWRTCANFSERMPHDGIKESPTPEIITAIDEGRNNLAIALLRQSFRDLESEDNSSSARSNRTHHSFLANLTLFCPFIGTELLWRQGLIAGPKDRRLD